LKKVPTTFRKDAPFLTVCAFLAAALSAAYVAFYLRGGPRIIDATSYFLEARASAKGNPAFHLAEPALSALGRSFVRHAAPDGPRAAVIFPPGYPAVLALGFLIGHPLVIGPLLAAAITFSTWALAREVAKDEPSSLFSIPRLAVIFSVACAALRYHTADTMSHGLSALCFSGALAFALGAVRALDEGRRSVGPSLGIGLCAGWLAATRPVSALALGLTLAFVLASTLRAHSRAGLRLIFAAALACLPGLVLLLAHQHAATGHWFTSSQTAYYAVADGPPGCFRYGFGANIGCVGEHGEFVQHNPPHGYGAYAPAARTLRRLKQHLVDAGNSEPFFLVVLAGLVFAWRDPRWRLLSIGVLAQIAAYVPFYFDGNYPGGGARFYADVLPLEHVLAALAVTRFAERAIDLRAQRRRIATLIALVPLGFFVRGRFEHEALRDRDGGRPMLEASRLPHVPGPALLFIDTDHGFNLAFDPDNPTKSLSSNQWSVVRSRGDALDLFAWQARGKPAAYRYEFPLGNAGIEPEVRVIPYVPAKEHSNFIEAANLWPFAAQEHGYGQISWAEGFCTREPGSREVIVVPVSPDKPASITFDLPASFLKGQQLVPVLGFEGQGSATMSWLVDGRIAHSEQVAFDTDKDLELRPPCRLEAPFVVPHELQSLSFRVVRNAGPANGGVAINRFLIRDPEKH